MIGLSLIKLIKYSTVIQTYVKGNKGRRRSLRHADLSNRFTCLPSDDDDDSSIHSGASVDSSPTDQIDSNISNPIVANDSFQHYRDFSEMSQELPCPVAIDDHNSSLLFLSVDKSNTNLPYSSISCPVSSYPPPALSAPHAAAPTEHIPVNTLTSPTQTISHLHSSNSLSSIWIPRSISFIAKSPNPEKWTLALQNEINSLISQKVFDNTEVNISLVDKN